MEKIISNLKLAAKNVFFHLNEFIAFFIAVFVIQVAFGVVGLSYYNNNAIDYKYASEDDEYHIELRNLNSAQYFSVKEIDSRYSNLRDDMLYEPLDAPIKRKVGSETRYDLYIKFIEDDPAESYKAFNRRFSKALSENSDGGHSIEFSEIMKYYQNVNSNKWVFVLSIVILTLISLFLMITLFGYRLNHFKFTYGIYLTFGANYKKLVSSSFWEMLLVTLVTTLPASLVSVGLSMYIFRRADFVFNLTAILIMAVMSLLVTSLSVLGPMKLLAWSSPLKALKAEDNSNFVSSPGVSSKRFFSSFPGNYILGTFFRYKKYVLKLILCGVVFGLVFVGGVSFSHLYEEYLDYNRPSYTLNFNDINNTFTEEIRERILDLDGVVDVVKIEECSAGSANSHVLLSNKDRSILSDSFGVKANGGDYHVTNSVIYRVLDEGMVDYLGDKYEVEGDLASCLDSENLIAVSNSRFNQEVLKLEPGDEIYIATYICNEKPIENIETGKEYMLQQLEHNRYSYTKYTVGAVISGMPTGAQSPIYLPAVDYSVITRNLPSFTRADIYTSLDLSDEDAEKTHKALQKFTDSLGTEVSLDERANVDIDKQMEKNYIDFINVLSVIVLIIMPVLLMFAQVLFYFKRDTEMYVLEAFGATEKEIRSIYFGDGAVMAIISGVLYAVFSLLIVYVLNRIGNVLFMYPGFDFEVPWFAFIFGLVITCAMSFLSAVIPYAVYKKKKAELLSSVAGEV